MDDIYRTLKEPSKGLCKDRGSKFIALAYPVDTLDQVKEILATLRKEYHDARHHCYAWRIGPGEQNYRVNDDGEPTNSAGKPILGQIQSMHLNNILIVVVRYFGGTLLGVGGLIQAYRTAAREAVEAGTVIEKYYLSGIRITFPYPLLNEVLKIARDHKSEIVQQDFSESCSVVLRIRSGLAERVTTQLNRIESVEAKPVEL